MSPSKCLFHKTKKLPLPLNRWHGKVAIVTGASCGIGAAIAARLVKEGLKVVGFARRSERIEKLAKKLSGKKGKLYAVKVDISKEEEIIKGFKWVADNVGPVHILINNAGVAKETSLIDGDIEQWMAVLDTNVLGLSVATREAVSVMKANDIAGHIVHINSVAGHGVPDFPNMNVYPASKHAVTALTETLRQELNRIGSKIKVTSVSPGTVRTEIAQTNGWTLDNKVVEELKKLAALEAEDIADSVLFVLSTPPHVQIHELLVHPVGGI